MSASLPLWQQVEERIQPLLRRQGVRATSATRLALLVTGILAARSAVQTQVAAALLALGLTEATTAASLERRLRRTRADSRLHPVTCYQPAVAAAIDWAAVRRSGQPLVLIVDESSHTDRVHLLRVALAYRGGAIALAWAVWEQNLPQPHDAYWRAMDQVLAQVKTLLPLGLRVVVVADRAYDIPPFIDRLRRYGWHWVIRVKLGSSLRYRDHQGHEHVLGQMVQRTVSAPGRRWKGRGAVFKGAGWRTASVVALWGPGQQQPLAVITDLAPRWAVLALYDRRFWIEASFRADKRGGWGWEASAVATVAGQAVLLLALAWASLLAMLLGAAEAARRSARLGTPGPGQRPPRPQRPKQSVLRMGVDLVLRELVTAGGPPWPTHLPDVQAGAWNQQWYGLMARCFIFHAVRP